MNLPTSPSLRLALLALVATGLQASPLSYDGFNYTTDSSIIAADNGAGGTGWVYKWTGGGLATIKSSDTSITYSSDTHTYGGGNSMSISGGNTQNAASRTFSETTLSDGSDVFFSFIVRVTGGTDGNPVSAGSFVGISLLDSSFAIASDNGIILNGPTLGARVANVTNTTSDTLRYGETYLVVGRFSGWDNTTKTYQQTSVWLNPTSDGFTNTPTGSIVTTAGYASTSVASGTATGSDGYRGVTVRTNALGDNIYLIDDFRIGTTWNDVVLSIPEPAATAATFTVVSLAVATTARRRQR